MNQTDLKTFLDEKYDLYNNKDFIGTDPIQIPHQFTKREDIEIAGFLIATIAWGQRKSIIANGNTGAILVGGSIRGNDATLYATFGKKF